MDSESTRLLWDLRAALLKAMAESREMQLALDRLREVGWSAYVVIDEASAAAEAAGGDAGHSRQLGPADPPNDESCEMSGTDLSFLRALGIDPRPESHGL